MDIIQLLDREINRLETEKLKLLHPLQNLFWECTLRCNMQCRHCGSECVFDSNTPDMPLADFLKVLDQVAQRYNPRDVFVQLVGGEPLVRPDLDECGAEVSRRGFLWCIVTNAYLLDEKRLERLIKAGMNSIAIDIDGLYEQHTWLRRNEHSWQRAMNAARLLSQTSLTWDVITCVTPRTIEILPRLKHELYANGVRRWRLFTITPMGRASHDDALVLDSKQLRRVMDFIVETRLEGLINLSFACNGYLGDYEGKVRSYHFQCQSGLTTASIRANGDISGCLSVRSNYTQGNIYRDSFCEVWENKFDCMRDRGWMKQGECADCKVFDYCQGEGMHLRRDDGYLIDCHYRRLYPESSNHTQLSH